MESDLNKRIGGDMNVGLVVDVDYPHVGEVRPRKLAHSLHEGGHRVVFISANSRERPVKEDIGYATVYRYPFFLQSRFYRLFSTPSPLNPSWVFWIAQVARKENLDVLISSNIRIALPAILACKLLRIPHILDLQENNPELVKLRPKTSLAHYISRNSVLVGWLERLCVRWSDHVWIVVEERFGSLQRSARKSCKVTVIHHTAALKELQSTKERTSRKDADFTLIYVGLYAPGVSAMELILRSLPYVLKRDYNVRLVIGGGREMEPLVTDLGLQEHVMFDGFIEPEKLLAWLQKGDVGLIAYKMCPATNTTISVKLFHYMAAGLPVLSTDLAPTRRIVEETGCGVIIPEGGSPSEVADIILRLKNSPEERAEMGRRGRQAVLEKYNWELDFSRALRSIERLCDRRLTAREFVGIR